MTLMHEEYSILDKPWLSMRRIFHVTLGGMGDILKGGFHRVCVGITRIHVHAFTTQLAHWFYAVVRSHTQDCGGMRRHAEACAAIRRHAEV